MVPQPILSRLASLRHREMLLRFFWGAARWLALLLLLLLVGCLIDFGFDQFRQTPLAVRYFLAAIQLLALVVCLALWLVEPQLRRPADNELALQVEEGTPALQHRLISAVQLNEPGAKTGGMSPEMIQHVTQEAIQQTTPLNFTRHADHRRLAWAIKLLAPVTLVVVVPLLVWPDVAWALLQRQFLADVTIPRSVYLVSDSPTTWPQGEEVTLKFRVTGPGWDQEAEGSVVIHPEGQSSESYPLTFKEQLPDGAALYTVNVPPGHRSFTYRAWLLDGRTDEDSRLQYEARPVVVEQRAWVVLPKFCGLRPSGQPYEQEQTRGEIVGIRGSGARVWLRTQKPIKQAKLELLGLSPGQTDGPEVVLDTLKQDFPAEGAQQAEFTFQLPESGTAYRMTVLDTFGFANSPPPRRGLRAVPEEAPQVVLLPEQFLPESPLRLGSPLEDFEVDGMPVPPGGRIRIAYTCSGTYGLGRVDLRYRVLKKMTGSDGSDQGPQPQTAWIRLPLIEVQGTGKSGKFDLRLGVFEGSKDDEQIQFHAVPSPEPDRILGRTQGGGRFDFETRGIPDGKGGTLEMKPGDQIELQVEVFADRDVNSARPSARSEVRVKTIVSPLEFARWIDETLQEERRIRQLELRQRGVFEVQK